VIFSDESRFCLGMHDGRRRVRRLRGERRNFAFSIERPVARTVGVMVWGVICFGSRLTNLHNPPLILAALRHEIQVAWDSVPQDEINHLIRSMPRRDRECIESRGGPTHY
ncbi:unnamed protein product, partial [Tenebrio molitor]